MTLDVPLATAPAPAGTVGVTGDPTALPRGAGILFATKGHQLRKAAAHVRSAWPVAGDGAGWVGGLQNGMAKDDVLAEVFGAERVVGAVTILGGERRPEGEIAVASLGCTYLGEIGTASAEPSARVRDAVARLRAAGIPAEAPPDIRTVLWSKACNAAGVFGVTSVLRISTPRLFRDPHLIRAYLGLVRETAAIAAAHGVPVGDYTNFPIRTYVTRPDEETVDGPEPEGVPGSRGHRGRRELRVDDPGSPGGAGDRGRRRLRRPGRARRARRRGRAAASPGS